jgi:hypothetical protein
VKDAQKRPLLIKQQPLPGLFGQKLQSASVSKKSRDSPLNQAFTAQNI